MDDGWTVTRRNRRGGYPIAGGTHGYDNTFASMQALFIADGPAFKDGARVDTVMNLDVYELVCRLLGLTPAPNDGSFERIKSVIKP
jgi:predicted AlkP superfamily pyrophosphatase or phosphodiesterase